jgi:myo-inositol-1(or 4)-monophosphatase
VTADPTLSDLELIVDAAREAGAMALDAKAKGLTTTYKPGDSPVTNADLAVDAFLKERLISARPDYGWLSEETADDPRRLGCRRLFVVDPIDGTRAYINDRPWWVVSIAVVDGDQSVAGAVFAPVVDETYAAAVGQGATLNGSPIRARDSGVLKDCAMVGDKAMFVHPAWPTPWPPMRVESRNATAYRLCLVASGAFDASVTLAPKADWDVAAGDLIAREAGAVVCDHKGRAFAYNRPHPSQASLVVAGPTLAALILERTRPIDLPNRNTTP